MMKEYAFHRAEQWAKSWALPAFDALFEKTKRRRDGPERNALYRQMDKLAFAYMPIVNHLFLRRSAVSQRWVTGYHPHPVHLEPWKYLDVDMRARALTSTAP